MNRYIHAQLVDRNLYIYDEEGLKLERFSHKSDAIFYLQRQGFKIAVVTEIEMWFVKKLNE